MANIKVPRGPKSSSTNPMPKANKKKSGSQKLKEFRERQAAKSKPGESPSQYREKIKKQKAEEQKRIQEAAKAARTGGGMQLSPMAKQIVKNNPIKYKPEQIQPLVNKITSSSSPTNPTANKKELEDIRAIMGAGFKPGASVLGELGKQYQMKQALEQDVKLREQRINERNKVLGRQEKQLNQAEHNLKSYDKYIKNGQFTGNESQYNAYKSAYDSYEKLYNRYSSNYQLQKTDIVTFNKNKQSIKSKKPAKKLRKGYNKISAAYDAANLAVGSKLPNEKTAQKAIEKYYNLHPATAAIFKNSKTQKQAKKIVDFTLGGYSAVKKKPVKAAVTFATFFVGGVVLKGLGTAAKSLGAGAKTAKAAKLIEGGVAAVYVTSTGRRYMKAEDAKQAGFVTGDVIFNELLPAGMGLRYGVKVVKAIPKGARRLKFSTRRFVKSESAQLGRGTKTKAEFQKEFDAILKRTQDKAIRNAQKQSARKLTREEIKNIKSSIARNKKKELEELINKGAKQRAREEDTLARQISQQFQKQRKQKAKAEFEKKNETLKGKDKEPTVTNITRKSKNLVKKAIRLREKYETGRISKAEYDRQIKGIMKQARDIENLKKYAVEIGKKPTTSNARKSVSSAVKQAKQYVSAKARALGKTRTKLGTVVIPSTALDRMANAAIKGKSLPASSIKPKAKPATRNRPKGALSISPRGRSSGMSITEMTDKINKVQKTVKKPTPRPRTGTKTAKEIVPPRIPQMRIPKVDKKRTKRTKKTRTTRRYDSKQFENAVANINSIFG